MKRKAEYGPYAGSYGFKKRKTSKKKIAKSLRAKVNQLIAGQETKFFDTQALAGATTALTATVIPLSSIPQGDDATTRDGRKVSYKSLNMRFLVTSAAGAGANYRVLVIYDRQTNNTNIGGTDIFEDQANYLSPVANKNSERMVVLYDSFAGLGKGLTFHNNVATTVAPGHCFVNLNGYTAEYVSGTTGTPNSGGLSLVFITQSVMTINYWARLKFTDS